MKDKEKNIAAIEKKILDELEEEIRELKRQGKLYKFEEAMENAMNKFKKALKEKTEEALEETVEGDNSKKKHLPEMRTRNKKE